MNCNGNNFLDRITEIIRTHKGDDAPLIKFKHPKELEELLDLDIKEPTNDDELEKCLKTVMEYSVKTHKPNFKNQLYGGTDPYGLAGAIISESLNTGQHTYEVAPAFTLIELKVISHVLKLFGYSDGDGIFSPGGSMSLLYGLAAARYKAFPEVKTKGMRGLPEMIIFTSQDSHYSVKKAAHWLGFGTENVVTIETNDSGQMQVEELEKAIKYHKDKGKYPVFVNATAGTTVLGAIDDLEAVAGICKKYGIWMHVDACWGGGLILSKKYKYRLRGIEKSNSISWNPHKMPGAPLQCSIFLISQQGLLHEANSASAQYLFQSDKYYDVSYDTGDKSIQCGRKIDAFKLWLMWKARGDSGLNQLADHTMSMAEFCLTSVRSREGFKLVSDTLQCPNVCFWYIPTFMRQKEMDEKWWDLIHKITPKIKELLTLSSRLMIAYSPVGHRKNFFRFAFNFHPTLKEHQVTEILDAIAECGETITPSMLC